MGDQGIGSSGSQIENRESDGSSGSHIIQRQLDVRTTPYQPTNASTATPTMSLQSQTPSSTSSSSKGLSSSDRTAIVAGVLGGVGGLLIISLIAIYFLQKRKTKKPTDRKGVTQKVSYNGLNSSFAGVPFIKKGNPSGESEIPRPPMVADTSYPGAYTRGGQSNYPDLSSERETDRFLPGHEEAQHRMSNGVNGFYPPSDNLISPVTTHDPFTDQNRLSQMSQNTISPTRPGLIRHDTMGFPLDDDDTSFIGPDGQQHRLSRVMQSPRFSVQESTIICPSPIHPSISQEDLEQGIWHDSNQDVNQVQPQHLNSLSSNYDNQYEFENENENDIVSPLYQSYPAEQSFSPVSALSGSWIAAHNPHLAATGSSGNIRRNVSQRTESSFAPSVISDTELERLGVGHRGV
ncbi:hypothetical protein MFRU_042g00780 [Monilinia fructicola]|nr:hypothetical protein MFRU_042g00780 [Monilinia fructicola]